MSVLGQIKERKGDQAFLAHHLHLSGCETEIITQLIYTK